MQRGPPSVFTGPDIDAQRDLQDAELDRGLDSPAGQCLSGSVTETQTKHLKTRNYNREEAWQAAKNAKLEEGNIRAAVRILCDGDGPATPNERNLELLKEEHPIDEHHETLQYLPNTASVVAWQATASEVLQAIRSFPSGSAAGPDGFRPDHLKDLVGFSGSMQPLVEAITEFVDLLLPRDCPKEIRPILFGGSLIALNKESGGLRPIAIGYVWRRLK